MSSQRLVLRLESFSGHCGQRELGSRVRGCNTASVGSGQEVRHVAASLSGKRQGNTFFLESLQDTLIFSPMRPKSKVQL